MLNHQLFEEFLEEVVDVFAGQVGLYFLLVFQLLLLVHLIYDLSYIIH